MRITPFAVALLAAGLYWPSHTYDFVFDDAFVVTSNADTTSAVPVSAVFAHDFWGACFVSLPHPIHPTHAHVF